MLTSRLQTKARWELNHISSFLMCSKSEQDVQLETGIIALGYRTTYCTFPELSPQKGE